LHETLKGLMVAKEEGNAKRIEKWCREKEATCDSFIDLQKRSLLVEAS
jgi:hypothetical protein